MLPGWPWRPYDPTPVLLLDSTLYPLHLAVQMRAPGPDAGMVDAPAFQPTANLPAELGTIVSLGAIRMWLLGGFVPTLQAGLTLRFAQGQAPIPSPPFSSHVLEHHSIVCEKVAVMS